MKKKYIVILILILVCICILLGRLLMPNKEEHLVDENELYSVEFNNTKIRFERYDYSLGQNQIVGVEKSTDGGKTYIYVTDQPFSVSMEPMFIFLNEELGFAVAKPNLTKSNNYLGFKVTNDGGKTFVDGVINYDSPDIDILTVEDVPYFDNDQLKLHCSVYQVKEDHSGYEDVDLIFVSIDNGLTWNLE